MDTNHVSPLLFCVELYHHAVQAPCVLYKSPGTAKFKGASDQSDAPLGFLLSTVVDRFI